MSNIITAKFCSDQTRAWTDELWQYDYGQILKFDGLELPDAYEVHFSNQPLTGETITQIGNADGVTIPDQFLQSGKVVYAWVYLHTGEDDGETEYMVTIPVSKRPEPSDEQPTPVEQSAIDQAIAALNTAVEKTAADVAEADEAAEQAAASAQAAQIAATEAGSYVDTVTAKANEAAASASAASQSASAADQSASDAAESAVETASGIARAEQAADDAEAAKTSAQAAQTAAEATVGQAEEYAVAAAGSATAASTSATQAAGSATSASGFAGDANTYAQAAAASATTAVTKAGEASQSATTASTAATNAGNAQTAAETAQGKAEDAQEAAEDAQTAAETAAASIQQSAAQIAQNTSDIADLTDDLNHKQDAPSTLGTDGQIMGLAEINGQLVPVWINPLDVQINGSSIVNDGVANIPIATDSIPGVGKADTLFGIGTDASGRLLIYKATDAQLKAGTAQYRAVVPYSQHTATFYGLAKVAGADMSSSSNPVGTYTDDAKDKIQKMLGLNQEAELINAITVAEDSTSITIETDSNGLPFALKDAKIQLKMTASTTGNADYISVEYMATLANGSSTNWLDWPTVRMNSATGCLNVYEFESIGGLYFLRASSARDYGGSSGSMTTMNMDLLIKSINKIKILRYSSTMTSIPAGTVIKIYGVRA